MIKPRSAIEDMAAEVRAYIRLRAAEHPPGLIPELERYERSVRVKLLMAEHYSAMLSNASSDRISQLEDTLSDNRDPVAIISDDDWEITIKSPRAGTLLRYMAFSAAVCSCVNATDTLARFIYRAFDMERQTDLPLHQVSLSAIDAVLHGQAPLRSVLREPPGLRWMKRLKDLRGECQHGMLAGSFYHDRERSDEPLVKARYCEDGNVVTIAEYLSWAMTNTATLIANIACVIADSPMNAIEFKA